MKEYEGVLLLFWGLLMWNDVKRLWIAVMGSFNENPKWGRRLSSTLDIDAINYTTVNNFWTSLCSPSSGAWDLTGIWLKLSCQLPHQARCRFGKICNGWKSDRTKTPNQVWVSEITSFKSAGIIGTDKGESKSDYLAIGQATVAWECDGNDFPNTFRDWGQTSVQWDTKVQEQ